MCSVDSSTNSINNKIDYALGVGAGYCTYKYGKKALKIPYRNYMLKNVKNLRNNNDIYKNKIDEALKVSGLASKGIQVIHIDQNNYPQVIQDLQKELSSKTKFKINFNPKKLNKPLKAITLGKNAGYANIFSKILINKDKISAAAFHEMGHAINHNSKGYKKILSSIRKPIALLGIPILAVALFRDPKSSKTSEEQKKSSKFLDFIKEHCGILASLALVPTVIEEGVASLNAKKLIKNILPKENCKIINRFNAKAWGSYVYGAAITGILVQSASYIKDKIANPKTSQPS